MFPVNPQRAQGRPHHARAAEEHGLLARSSRPARPWTSDPTRLVVPTIARDTADSKAAR